MLFSALAVILASNTERRWSAIKLNVTNFLKSGFVFPVPLTNYSPHPVRPAEKEDVSGDVPPKNPIMPRKRRSNQCLQCDRYFLTQVKHSWQSMTFNKLYDLVNSRKINGTQGLSLS